VITEDLVKRRKKIGIERRHKKYTVAQPVPSCYGPRPEAVKFRVKNGGPEKKVIPGLEQKNDAYGKGDNKDEEYADLQTAEQSGCFFW
jgi:hypothetical protein